jgi:hypothetical protein
MIKLLTYQTWLTRWDWFDYAQKHSEQVPFRLVDRSPCMEKVKAPLAHLTPRWRKHALDGNKITPNYYEAAAWNTVYLDVAIATLRKRGEEIPEATVAHIAPLGWEHIRLIGDYHFAPQTGRLAVNDPNYRQFLPSNAHICPEC